MRIMSLTFMVINAHLVASISNIVKTILVIALSLDLVSLTLLFLFRDLVFMIIWNHFKSLQLFGMAGMFVFVLVFSMWVMNTVIHVTVIIVLLLFVIVIFVKIFKRALHDMIVKFMVPYCDVGQPQAL